MCCSLGMEAFNLILHVTKKNWANVFWLCTQAQCNQYCLWHYRVDYDNWLFIDLQNYNHIKYATRNFHSRFFFFYRLKVIWFDRNHLFQIRVSTSSVLFVVEVSILSNIQWFFFFECRWCGSIQSSDWRWNFMRMEMIRSKNHSWKKVKNLLFYLKFRFH